MVAEGEIDVNVFVHVSLRVRAEPVQVKSIETGKSNEKKTFDDECVCLSFLLLLFCLWRGVAVTAVVVVVFSVFDGVRRPSLLFVLFSLLNDFNHLYIYKIINERKKRKGRRKWKGGGMR